jgi:hypothetical protein
MVGSELLVIGNDPHRLLTSSGGPLRTVASPTLEQIVMSLEQERSDDLKVECTCYGQRIISMFG